MTLLNVTSLPQHTDQQDQRGGDQRERTRPGKCREPPESGNLLRRLCQVQCRSIPVKSIAKQGFGNPGGPVREIADQQLRVLGSQGGDEVPPPFAIDHRQDRGGLAIGDIGNRFPANREHGHSQLSSRVMQFLQ